MFAQVQNHYLKEAPKEGMLDHQVIHKEKKDDDVALKMTRMENSHIMQVLPDEAKTFVNETGLNSGDASVVMTSVGKEDDHITGL